MIVIVNRDETHVSSAKSDLIVPIIPPVVQSRSRHGIPEPDHVVNLPPTMFTHPATPTGQVRVHDDVVNSPVRVGGSNLLK